MEFDRDCSRSAPADGLSDPSLVIMATLVGGINPSKSLAQSDFSQAGSFVFLPGSPIKEAGYLDTINQQRSVEHRFLRLWIHGVRVFYFIPNWKTIAITPLRM
jgi:hypothetical protein